MAMVDVGDTALYYEVSGHGPAMVFVHGMCGDATVWAGQAGRFSDRFTCVRYDRRGHSRSGRGRVPVSVARHADDAAALIDALGLAPCLLVASSGGAVIAVDLAIRHCRLLRGVVLSEPPLFSLDPDAGRAVGPEFDRILQLAATVDGQSAAVDAFFTLICPGLWAILDDNVFWLAFSRGPSSGARGATAPARTTRTPGRGTPTPRGYRPVGCGRHRWGTRSGRRA